MTELIDANQNQQKLDNHNEDVKIKQYFLAYLLFKINLRNAYSEANYVSDKEINLDEIGKELDKRRQDLNMKPEEVMDLLKNNSRRKEEIYIYTTFDDITRMIDNIIYLENKRTELTVKYSRKLTNNIKEDNKYEDLEFKKIFDLSKIIDNIESIIKYFQIENEIVKTVKLISEKNKYFSQNLHNFFLVEYRKNNKDGEDLDDDFHKNNDERINEFFDELKANYNKNVVQSKKLNVKGYKFDPDNDLIEDYNTDSKRKQIVKEWAKYILNDDEMQESSDEIYKMLLTDNIKLKYIITYYNIYEILKTLYFNRGCIIKGTFFEIIDNNVVKREKPMYIKINTFSPIKLGSDDIINVFSNNKDYFEPIFEIEYQEIATFSKIEFWINFIDEEEPINKLKTDLEIEYKQHLQDNSRSAIREKTNNKEPVRDIIKINNQYSIYKKAKNIIFSNSNKIDENEIFISTSIIDYNKINANFNNLKNDILFKNNDIVNYNDMKNIFMNKKLFDYLFKNVNGNEWNNNNDNNNNDNNNNMYKIIKKEYIEKYFFKINSHLNIESGSSNKYAQIKKVQLRLMNPLKLSAQINYNENNIKNYDSPIFFNHELSNETRLAIDNLGSKYIVFLDLTVFYTNNIKDSISIVDKLKYQADCLGRASNIDNELRKFLGFEYREKFLQKKLRNITRKRKGIEISSNKENKGVITQDNSNTKKLKIGGKKNIKLVKKLIKKDIIH